MTRAYEFARRLNTMGHEVTIVTSAAHLPEKYKDLTRTTRVNIEGVNAIIIPVPYSNYMSFSRRIRAFIQFAVLAIWTSARTPADVVFASSSPLTICIPAIAASLWQRIPMVFEVRDLWPELPIAVGALRNPIARFVAESMEWIAYHWSRHVVALSPGMAEGVQRRGIPSEQISVIPNSCDVDLFDIPESAGASIREGLGLRAGQPLIVYTGTFGLMNDVGFLVKVAYAAQEIAPDLHFLLIGSGAQFELVTEVARALGVLNKNVTVWKPLPKNEMPNVLAAATIATSLFLPIREMWNNSANKFFDALAAGKPIAINYGGWQAEILRATGAGIQIPATDYRQAAQELAAFAKDGAALDRAQAAAHDLAYNKFNRNLMAERLEQVLVQVAQK